MVDLKKLVEHPEKQEIISKLINGESPKTVSNYLKDKYPKPDEGHLRIPATMLQQFLDNYADHHAYVKKVVENEYDTKLDKKIAASLLDNKEWRERLQNVADEEIDFKIRLRNVLKILEARAEQIFDLIQSNPESTKADYVFTKYMELLMQVIEKGDKLENDRPDIRIEHSYTVQMVEQQSVALQQAIRKVLEKMGPEFSSMFMEYLNEELSKMSGADIDPTLTAAQEKREKQALNKVFDGVSDIEAKLLEEGDSE
jgi:hypothetical protein